jgi:hypothetical protein
MTTTVIYARVPETLKQATDDYAGDRGVTITTAVVELLERGLEANANARSVAELESKVTQLVAETAHLRRELHGAKSELQMLGALSQRTKQVVGTCPTCLQPITGYDLLAVGRCSKCGASLSALLAGKQRSTGLDQQEFLLLLGALGAVVGVALLASKA